MEECSEYSGPEGLRSVQSDCEIGEPGHSDSGKVPGRGAGTPSSTDHLGLSREAGPPRRACGGWRGAASRRRPPRGALKSKSSRICESCQACAGWMHAVCREEVRPFDSRHERRAS